MNNPKDALTEQDLDQLVALDAAQAPDVAGGAAIVLGTAALAAAVAGTGVAVAAVTLTAPVCPSSNCTKHWVGHK